MTVQTALSALYVAEPPRTKAVPSRVGLLDRALAWLRQRADARILREVDPRMAIDVGIEPPRDPRPAGYVVDPRPLWGIGLTPMRVTDAPSTWGKAGAGSTEILG